MRYHTHKHRIGHIELTFLLLGALLLLLLGIVAKGQTRTPTMRTSSDTVQFQRPLYREYRGVRLGMTATEVRTKLGEPAVKNDEQDYYVFSPSETAQVVYDTFKKVVTISIDYTGEGSAPDYKSIVGEGLLERPDGSLFRMVMYNSEGFWVTYNKSASVVPIVTITIGTIK